ncbi:MAG TPA: hypothetical protein VIF57_05065 [Polyangia bacterium]
MVLSRAVTITLLSVVVIVAAALPARTSRAAEPNACGCTQTDSGACICEKKARCGCPGLCEPQGCEAAREKTFQRELDAETKKVREADRQRTTDKNDAAPKVAPPSPPRPARTMTPVQQKELARLLDLYFAAHPAARAQSAGTLRDEVLPNPARAPQGR